MRAWSVAGMTVLAAAVCLMGCAKKESSFERAGKQMDSALEQMDRDLDKAVNQ